MGWSLFEGALCFVHVVIKLHTKVPTAQVLQLFLEEESSFQPGTFSEQVMS